MSADKVPLMARLGLVFLSLLFSAGCAMNGAGSPSENSKMETSKAESSRAETSTPETTGSSAEPGEISLEQIAANAPGQGAKRPRVVVAPSAAALSSALGPRANIPDSGEGVYLAAFWGVKPTGGFSMAAKSVRGEGSNVTVELALKRPPKDAFVSQALTYPYVVAVVRGVAVDAKFVFVDEGGRDLGWPVEREDG